jgi:hypothetical protein
MARSANLFGFFLDELHKADTGGGGGGSSSSALSSADFSAALDFALQPRKPQVAASEASPQPDVVGTILREVAKAEPASSTVVSLANATGLGLDTLLAGLQLAVDHNLLAVVSPAGTPSEYARTDSAKELKM